MAGNGKNWALKGHYLLLTKKPLVILPELAALIGLDEAIILQQMHYWLIRNAQDRRNEHDGYYWTFNSIPQWQQQFPFWSTNTIQQTLARLCGRGKDKPPKLLITGRYNQDPRDRTLWYRIDYDVLDQITQTEATIAQPKAPAEAPRPRKRKKPPANVVKETNTELVLGPGNHPLTPAEWHVRDIERENAKDRRYFGDTDETLYDALDACGQEDADP